jgi:hypothetical protein
MASVLNILDRLKYLANGAYYTSKLTVGWPGWKGAAFPFQTGPITVNSEV